MHMSFSQIVLHHQKRQHQARYVALIQSIPKVIIVLFSSHKIVHHFLYDPETRLANRKDAEAASFPFPGVFLRESFISEEEEEKLICTMDQNVWNESQSGRRKQVMWNNCVF